MQGLFKLVEDLLSVSTELNIPAVGACDTFHGQIGIFTKWAE